MNMYIYIYIYIYIYLYIYTYVGGLQGAHRRANRAERLLRMPPLPRRLLPLALRRHAPHPNLTRLVKPFPRRSRGALGCSPLGTARRFCGEGGVREGWASRLELGCGV